MSTRWCVITGAPSSGKTTVLEALGLLGFKWVPEVARVYIDAELSKGCTINEIRADEAAFQRALVSAKARVESELGPSETVFLDRAMPDSITYFRVCGLDVGEILETAKRFRYFRVFIFDRLPFVQDEARTENEDTANFLDRQLEIDYRCLGYDLIRIPVATVEERVRMILESIR